MKKYLFVILTALIFSSCSSSDIEYDYPEKVAKNKYARGEEKKNNKLFGEEGITIFGSEDETNSKGSSSVGVNSFLWRASLDTISFMPISSADPFGGVIITDWFSMPETPDVQFKINVFIMSSSLRADGVKVTAFKREKNNELWKDNGVDKETVAKIEDAILTRARELKHNSLIKK